jgi:hypothetical protein
MNSSLISSAKPDIGARPIDMHEVFYCLATLSAHMSSPVTGHALHLFSSAWASAMAERLWPMPSATAIRRLNRATLALDRSNASNSLDQAAMMEAAHVLCLLPSTQGLYGLPPALQRASADGATLLILRAECDEGTHWGRISLP